MYLILSAMAPFFPLEAAKKGMSETMAGFVFSVHPLTVAIVSPFFGKIIPKTGVRCILLSGIFVSGFPCILFGFLNTINSPTLFAVACFALRIIIAVGIAGANIAIYSYVLKKHPNSISGVVALMEAAIAIGISAGPAIGGFLYLFGFGMPFFVIGSILLVQLPICWLIVKSEPDCEYI